MHSQSLHRGAVGACRLGRRLAARHRCARGPGRPTGDPGPSGRSHRPGTTPPTAASRSSSPKASTSRRPTPPTPRAAASWSASRSPRSTTVDYTWFGTTFAPGVEPTTSTSTRDGKVDGELIGELAYGGKDVWLNRDAEDFTGVTPTVPAGFFAKAGRRALVPTPRRTATWTAARSPTAPALAAHGTLDDWARSSVRGRQDARTLVSAPATSLTGFVYDGVLRSGRPSARTSTSSPTRPRPR